MNTLLLYLVESSVCMTVLYAIYWFFLRRDTFFSINRFYLLAMVFFSMAEPLFPLRWTPTGASAAIAILLEPVLITPAKVEQSLQTQLPWIGIVAVIYFTGVLVFLGRFALQLIQLHRFTRRFGITEWNSHRVVSIDRGFSPFSFFNLVYINESMVPAGSLPAILEHEQVHIRQHHTFDMIVIELARVLQWFNPVIWLAGREMKNIHEYLADEGVLQNGISRHLYQQMILNETMGIRVNELTNNFNVSLLKKRIAMMTKSKSNRWAIGKVLFALPALAVLFLNLPTVPAEAMKPQDQGKKSHAKEVFTVVEKQPVYPGGQDALVKFLVANIKYPAEALKKGITGTVFTTFLVLADGTVSDVKIIRGIGGGCDEEAIRVVKLMPKWTPGEQKGKQVAVQYNLPIKFALDEKKKEEPKK